MHSIHTPKQESAQVLVIIWYLFTGHWCTSYNNKNLCRL